MRSLLPFLITGVATGSLYGLAGLGLVLTYRTSGVFNLGHGAIAAGGAYLFYTLHVQHQLAWPIAVLVTLLLFGTIVGFLLEHVTRGFSHVPQAIVVMATVGIMLGVQGFLFLRYGFVTRYFPEFLPTSGFTLQGVNVTWSQVISVATGAGSAAGLYAFLRWSRLGVAMRAVVDNPELTGLCGERPGLVRGAAWGIGSAFAALSGILLAPTLNLDVSQLTLLVVQAFGACAIGLFSSLPLTYAGGLIVGVSASVATKYVTGPPFNGIPTSVPFLILIAVLLAVPARKLPQRRSTSRTLIADSRPISRGTVIALISIGALALLAVPEVVGSKLPLWTSALTYVVIFGSLGLLVWTSGQLSLCHMSFVAVGATTMSHLEGVPWAAGLLLAGLFTVPLGALVAIPAIRLSGIYLALVTLGFGILMQNVVFQTSVMFGSGLIANVSRPKFGFIDGTSDTSFYYIVLVVAALTCVVLGIIVRGRLGRILRAMAETPTMLATQGLSVNATRLIVFCISAFFAGMGGAVAITHTGAANGVGFGPFQSLMLLAVLAIGGAVSTRLLPSALLAAAFIAIVPGYLTSFDQAWQMLAFGVFAILSALGVALRPQQREWFARFATTTVRRSEHGPVRARMHPTALPQRGRGAAVVAATAAPSQDRPPL